MSGSTLTDRVKKRVQGAKRDPAANGHSRPVTGRPDPLALSVFYDSGRAKYFVENSQGEWMEHAEASVRRVLKMAGYSTEVWDRPEVHQLDRELFDIQHVRNVHYAGPLAGFPKGLHDICGNRILVTRERRKVKPVAGKWPVLRHFLDQLLGDQLDYALGWIKRGLEVLDRPPPFAPGQVLAIAGPAGCGKNLFQDIITEVFGGRMAKPYRYLMGETTFNKDLLEAEHLAIQDEVPSTDLRARRHFGAALKNFTVNSEQSFHPKNRDAISLTPFWRLSLTLNDEPENLMVLPPLDDSLKDKIILLKAAPAVLPFDGEDLGGRHKFRASISAELPAFVWWLRRWQLHETKRSSRFGVAAWHNPDLIVALDDLNPEFRMMGLLDTLEVYSLEGYFTGTASALEKLLRELTASTGEAARLFTWPGACGTYLARLQKKFPDRIDCKRGVNNVRTWEIKKE